MCNIAGYSGSRQAASILLEMLRKQQPYDGDMSTGVATIHEGKLYYKKLVGDVDRFIREIDLDELPGTIGIAHTRPTGDPNQVPMHPNLNLEKTMALVTNGTTPKSKYWADWDKAADLLENNGYTFVHRSPNKDGLKSPKVSSNGELLSTAEMRVLLIDLYRKQGKSITRAMADACSDMYNDNISVMISQNYPDRIFALRTTRPMEVIFENGEAFMATTRFAFPRELTNTPISLPLFHTCVVTRNGFEVSSDRMDREPVEEMTPYTYAEAYKRFETLLKSDRAPLFFDDLEYAVGREMRDLWPNGRTFIQHARLVYEMLWQFEQEGRLKRQMRLQDHPFGKRHRWYFWLED